MLSSQSVFKDQVSQNALIDLCTSLLALLHMSHVQYVLTFIDFY